MKVSIDFESGLVTLEEAGVETTLPLAEPRGFEVASRAWLRAAWDARYAYSFSWLGRPVIQLPEDLVRAQEVIYAVKPDTIIETGVAHGGSLVFYATLLKAIGRGRVLGVDIDIRAANRAAIEAHELGPYIRLFEGDSTSEAAMAWVRSQIGPSDIVLVILDSSHTRDHVGDELETYAPLVSPGSYLVVTDGVMAELAGAPGAGSDWQWNNPAAAADEFLARHPEFTREEPGFPFNEGHVRSRVTYWPGAWLRRR